MQLDTRRQRRKRGATFCSVTLNGPVRMPTSWQLQGAGSPLLGSYASADKTQQQPSGMVAPQGPGLHFTLPPCHHVSFTHTPMHQHQRSATAARPSQSHSQRTSQRHEGHVLQGAAAWLQGASSAVQSAAAAAIGWLQHAQPHGCVHHGRPMLLASLSSATATATASRQEASWSNSARKLPPRAQQVPQLVGMHLPDVFARAQAVAATIWEYYKDKGEEFPRPCPVCGSCAFFEAQAPSPSTAGGAPGTASGGAIKWESRPLACEQCHRWWHLGCLKVHHLQDLPTQPWFHSQACRHTYLQLECEAERGELPAWELGLDAGQYAVSLMTEADHRHFVMGDEGLVRGDMQAVYQLLSAALPSNLLLGLGNASSEFAGGRYTLLLSRMRPQPGSAGARVERTPLAAASFDVYGPHAAQLHLLATAEEERGKGHARALLDILEYRLHKLGVARLLAQPRADQLPLFTGKLGFEVLHPADAALVHTQVPVAYFDAVIVDKPLQ